MTSRLALVKMWSRISSGHSSSMMVFSLAPPRTWSEGEIRVRVRVRVRARVRAWARVRVRVSG